MTTKTKTEVELVSITYKLEELLVGKGNRYRLTVIASKRARELNAGAPPLIESKVRKTTSLALEEVLRGKIMYGKRTKLPSEVPPLKGSSAEAEKEEKNLPGGKEKEEK